MMPTALPAWTSKLASLSSTWPLPGAATVILSIFSDWRGAGSSIGSTALLSAVVVSRRRWNAMRAATKGFQLAIA